jgi:hypothetical protein
MICNLEQRVAFFLSKRDNARSQNSQRSLPWRRTSQKAKEILAAFPATEDTIRRVPAYQYSEARIIFGDVAPPRKLKAAPFLSDLLSGPK